MKGSSHEARCSFCGKHQDQVRKLVAGPGVFICDQCIALCNEVLAEDAGPRPPTTERPGRGGWIRRMVGPKPPHPQA